jgi:hypothetical protein
MIVPVFAQFKKWTGNIYIQLKLPQSQTDISHFLSELYPDPDYPDFQSASFIYLIKSLSFFESIKNSFIRIVSMKKNYDKDHRIYSRFKKHGGKHFLFDVLPNSLMKVVHHMYATLFNAKIISKTNYTTTFCTNAALWHILRFLVAC